MGDDWLVISSNRHRASVKPTKSCLGATQVPPRRYLDGCRRYHRRQVSQFRRLPTRILPVFFRPSSRHACRTASQHGMPKTPPHIRRGFGAFTAEPHREASSRCRKSPFQVRSSTSIFYRCRTALSRRRSTSTSSTRKSSTRSRIGKDGDYASTSRAQIMSKGDLSLPRRTHLLLTTTRC